MEQKEKNIVERLRSHRECSSIDSAELWHPEICDEAADEIERLQKALDMAHSALEANGISIRHLTADEVNALRQ